VGGVPRHSRDHPPLASRPRSTALDLPAPTTRASGSPPTDRRADRATRANPRWGYLRIVGELKKLGVTVSKGSVANILRSNDLRPARRAGPIWAEFLRAQAKGIVATDFFTSTGCSSERHLERVLEELVEHYNAARPHRGIDLEVPIPYVSGMGLDDSTRIQRADRLGGLLHEYSIAA